MSERVRVRRENAKRQATDRLRRGHMHMVVVWRLVIWELGAMGSPS